MPRKVCTPKVQPDTCTHFYTLCGYRCSCIRLFLRHAPATSFRCIRIHRHKKFATGSTVSGSTTHFYTLSKTATGSTSGSMCNRINLQPDQPATGSNATGSTCIRINTGESGLSQHQTFGAVRYRSTTGTTVPDNKENLPPDSFNLQHW